MESHVKYRDDSANSGHYKFTNILEWEALGVTAVHNPCLPLDGFLLPDFHENNYSCATSASVDTEGEKVSI